MLRPRIIPCLLVHNKGLVKTVKFQEGKYVGDPMNAVRIFNEKQADELMVLDIDATANGVEPDMKMIQFWAVECRMPLCYGGGVRTAGQAAQIINVGVEKVAISAAAVERPALVSEIAQEVGSQSVVVVLDVKRAGDRYEVWTHNASRNSGLDAVEFATRMQALGVGEIVINSVDRDGTMSGYDVDLAQRIRAAVSVPMTVLGGASSVDDMGQLINRLGIIGAAAGSLFVFKGTYRAVLINYPGAAAKDLLTAAARLS